MKKSFFFIFIFFITACGTAPVYRDITGTRIDSSGIPTLPDIRKRMALLALYNEAPYGDADLEVTGTEELRLELSRLDGLIVESDSNSLFGSSEDIYRGGGLKLALAAKQARAQGINFVLYGRILGARVKEVGDAIGFIHEVKSYAEANLELRVFDVNSIKEIYKETFYGNVDDSNYQLFNHDPKDDLQYRRDLLRYAVRVAARKSILAILNVSKKLDWTGRVAKIIGTKIYLNAGLKSGIRIGDILKVMTEGPEVFDPETGALIGQSKGEIKGTLEIIDYFGPDGAIATLHSGGNVQEGDFVQMYSY